MNANQNDRFDDDFEELNDEEDAVDEDMDDEEDMWDEEEEMSAEEEALHQARLTKWQLDFVELCEALEQNDPTVTDATAFSISNYGIPLGRALVGNTHVRTMSLSLSPDNIHAPGEGVETMALLLQYLRQGPELRFIFFVSGTLSYMRPAMEALAHSPKLETLIFQHTTEIPVEELSHLLRTTQTLKTIFMPMMNHSMLTDAFGSNQTLEDVTLDWTPAFPPHNGAILHSLGSLETLRSLSFNISDESNGRRDTLVDAALSECLKANQWLTHLKFSHQSFGEKRMHHLMEGLTASHSLTHLSLSSCMFDGSAIDVVALYARSTTGNSLTSIVEMDVHEPANDVDANSARLVALLAEKSPMTLLKWSWYSGGTNSGNFWTVLESHASTMHLCEIRLHSLPVESIDAMTTCVPKLCYLRELHVAFASVFDQPDLCEVLADMVKKSGSLQTVEFPSLFRHEAASKIITAALERNRSLPRLLAASGEGDHGQSAGEALSTDPSLVPTLMLSALQAPQMAPNQVLAGLLAMSESVTAP